MQITIGIKTLNEARHIAGTIEGALVAIAGLDGEIVVADSGSRDGTIEIASRYPVRIVQLANESDRRCGAGAQLAYQHARGDYFYMLDGDMILDKAFLHAALSYLEANPEIAAVGGEVREVNIDNAEFAIRAKALAADRNRRTGIVEWLDGGGLYRSQALRDVGWFADRNLHAFEEFELGARLKARGWKVARIDHHAVDHYGHQLQSYALLLRRFRSGYIEAAGETLRAAYGKAHFGVVVRRLAQVRYSVVVTGWWLALIAAALLGQWTMALVLLALPFLFLSWRRRSFGLGLYSLLSWNLATVGLYRGLFQRRTPPGLRLASRELTTHTPSAEVRECSAV